LPQTWAERPCHATKPVCRRVACVRIELYVAVLESPLANAPPIIMNPPKKTPHFRPVFILMETFGLSLAVAGAIVTLLAVICLLAVVWFVESFPPSTLTLTSGPAGSTFRRFADSARNQNS